MKTKINNFQSEFVKGAAGPGQYPEYDYPEIAFSGRSNVGKSSLLNSIVQRKNLAHTSSTPGKTKEINFFLVEDQWSFADLPGFGYAAVGKSYRQKWAALNYDYLGKRDNLRLVCALIDSRHDPMDNDLALIEWLENNSKSYIIVLTKCDKLSAKKIDERKEQLGHLLQNCRFAVDVLPYSSVSGMGRKELLGVIRRVCSENAGEM